MDTQGFRDSLDRLNLTQGALARMFTELGDTAEPITIRRRVERWAQGGSNIPGEIAAFMTLLERYPAILNDLRSTVSLRPGPRPLAMSRRSLRKARRGAEAPAAPAKAPAKAKAKAPARAPARGRGKAPVAPARGRGKPR